MTTVVIPGKNFTRNVTETPAEETPIVRRGGRSSNRKLAGVRSEASRLVYDMKEKHLQAETNSLYPRRANVTNSPTIAPTNATPNTTAPTWAPTPASIPDTVRRIYCEGSTFGSVSLPNTLT